MKYKCVYCRKKADEKEVNIIEGVNDTPIYYCNDCYEKIINEEIKELLEEV